MADLQVFKDKFSTRMGKLLSKGKTTKEMIRIKGEIDTCEGVVNRSYIAIGRKFYEMYAEGGYNPEFDKQMTDIKNARNAIKELEEQLADIKASEE